jgi:hypothetical protein
VATSREAPGPHQQPGVVPAGQDDSERAAAVVGDAACSGHIIVPMVEGSW